MQRARARGWAKGACACAGGGWVRIAATHLWAPRPSDARPSSPWRGESHVTGGVGGAHSRSPLLLVQLKQYFGEADVASPAPSALGAAFSDMMRITPAHSTRSSVVGHALFEAGEDGGPQTLIAVHSGIQALDAVGLCGQGGPVR